MMRFLTRSLQVLLFFGLAGCASTMSKRDCETADFYQLGLQDGKNGKSTERLSQLTNTCQQQGVAVSEEKYNYGRKVGLTEYCSASRGRKDAQDGKADSFCLNEKVPPYETAYFQQLNVLKSDRIDELKGIQKSKSNLQQKEEQINSDLQKIDQQQAAPVPPPSI